MDNALATQGGALSSTVECPMCAEFISSRAKKCKHCGEVLDLGLRRAEEALRAAERHSAVVINNSNNNTNLNSFQDVSARPVKSRGVAVVLALLLGGIGAHKFYLGRPGQGLLYLLFCWTYIPMVVGFVEGILYALSNSHNWHLKYG